jgi:hypothetical protein
MKLGIAEILSKASAITDDAARIGYLRQNQSTTLHMILRGAFDPTIKWALPEGIPPYKPNVLVDQHHRLFTETRKLYLFVEGGSPNLKQLRRETLYVELLETVDPEDAKLLLSIKDKTLPYPGVTLDIVNQAFPGLINV